MQASGQTTAESGCWSHLNLWSNNAGRYLLSSHKKLFDDWKHSKQQASIQESAKEVLADQDISVIHPLANRFGWILLLYCYTLQFPYSFL